MRAHHRYEGIILCWFVGTGRGAQASLKSPSTRQATEV